MTGIARRAPGSSVGRPRRRWPAVRPGPGKPDGGTPQLASNAIASLAAAAGRANLRAHGIHRRWVAGVSAGDVHGSRVRRDRRAAEGSQVPTPMSVRPRRLRPTTRPPARPAASWVTKPSAIRERPALCAPTHRTSGRAAMASPSLGGAGLRDRCRRQHLGARSAGAAAIGRRRPGRAAPGLRSAGRPLRPGPPRR